MHHLIRTNFTVHSVQAENSANRIFGFVKTKQRFFYLCLLAILSLSVINDTKAQTTYYWDCSTASATSGTNANLSVGSFSQGNNNGTTTLITTTSPSSGSGAYTGNSGTSNFGAAARTGAINTGASGSAYFEVTLTPASGYLVTVTGLSLGSRGTGTGPVTLGLRTSKDSYGANIATATVLANSTWALSTPTVTSTTSAAGTALTLRIYGYGGTGSPSANTANWRIDDISLTVNVTSAEVAPAAPTSGGNQSICLGSSVPNLSATAPSGAEVDWYSAATAGTLLQSNSTSYNTGATTAGTYTYYAESRNNPGSLVSATRTAVTLTINPVVTPTLDIDASDLQPTPGSSVDFYVNDQTNQGTSPTYQWFKNSSPISGATSATYSSSVYANGDTYYLIMQSNAVCASPTSVQSNTLTMIVNTGACSGAPPQTTTNATIENVCSGSSSDLSLTGLGGLTGYTFQWQESSTQNGTYSNISGANSAVFSLTNITNTKWYKCIVTCSNSSLSTASSPIQVTVTANLTPSVVISSNSNPACAGSSVTYSATPTNGGAAPVYAWYLNNNLVNGQTSASYSSSSFANGDSVYAVLTSNYVCLTTNNAVSNKVEQNITANVAASVSIGSSANPSCSGANVTFTATPTNGGSNPTYQWYNGASPISGENGVTYNSTTITSGSSITVRMTSNATCVTGSPATSNAVVQTVTANVTPSLTIASNNNPVCLSGNATFNISPSNGGATPVYAWYLNNVLVSGQTGTTYTLSPVTNGDSVYATMTSSITCVTTANATSNVIKESVVSQTAPTVTIAANPGTSIYEGTNITFTATPIFGGTAPTYQWKLNGNNVGTGLATYSSSTLENNDIVSCAMVSNYTCATTSNASSNNLTITILSANPFTPGNILVYKVGDSATALSANGSPIFLNEYTPSGTFVQSKRLSRTTAGVNTILSAATSNSEGYITLNTNGTNVAVGGYNAPTTNASSLSGASAATIRRIVAIVDRNQNIDTTTKLKDVSGNIRGVVLNGNKVYASSSSAGARYASKGDSISTQLSTTVSNLRVINIFNGQLYVSSQSGAFRMASVGTGLPTINGQTIVNLPGFSTSTGSPYGFYFADLNSSIAGVDVLYVCDDVANSINKYSLVNGNWTANGSVTASGVRGLTGYVSGSTVQLFATGAVTSPSAGTFVYALTDNSGYNATISGTVTNIVDRSSVSLIAFRGIAFAPTEITAQPSNTNICTGSTGQFSITMATGTNASIYTYQWQESTNGGSSWNNLANGGVYSNVTTASMSITNPSIGLSNNQYRCVVTYMSNAILTSNAATLTVTTTVTPSVSISGASTVCSGSNTTFTALATNGGTSPSFQWKKNGNNVGSASSIQFAGGTLNTNDVISCVLTANNTCQTTATANSNEIILTVNESPIVGTSSSVSTFCTLGSVKAIYNTNTSGGGVWVSSNPSIASVSTAGNGASGAITANANGTANITYTKTAANGCVSTSNAVAVTVAAVTTPNAISGNNNICVQGTTNLTTSTTGGVWSSSNNKGTISNGGVYTGTNGGAGEARYTVTNGSGCSAYASYAITVNNYPNLPTISYAPGTVNPQTGAPAGSFCTNKTFTVVGTPTGGVWSKTGVISVTSPAGVVSTGSTPGAGSLTYTITVNGCSSSRTISGNVVSCAARGVVDNSSLTMGNSQWTMYPNPAKSVININVETLVGSGKLLIIDYLGKLVKEQPLSMGTNTVNIANLNKGMYFVSTITTEGKTTKKLVVE